mgnify:FL=1
MVFTSVDEFTKKKQYTGSHRKWLRDHEMEVERFLQKNISEDDLDKVVEDMLENPYVHRQMVAQSKDSNRKKQIQSVEQLAEDNGRIDLIVGGKGSGKTAFVFWICEQIHKKWPDKEIWWYGPPTELPDYINISFDESEIPPGAIVIIDEASVQFAARDHSDPSQVDLMKKIPVIRHKDKNALVVTQSTNLSDRNWVTLADGIFFKSYQVFQGAHERDEVTIHDDLDYYMPVEKNQCLYMDDDDIVFFNNPLPDCWKERYSKPYGPFRRPAEKYRFVIMLEQWVSHPGKIREQLQLRDASLEDVEIRLIKQIIERRGRDELLDMSDAELETAIDKGLKDDPLNMIVREEDLPGKDYNFKLKPSREEKFRRKADTEPDFDLFSRLNWNRKFFKELQQRQEEDNVVLSIYGQQGSGKSYTGLSIAGVLCDIYGKDPAEDVHIYFDRSQITEELEDKEAGEVIILDEQKREQGTGSQQSADNLANKIDILRQEQIHFIFISPSLEDHNHYFVIEPYGIDFMREVSRNLVYTPELNLMGYITLEKPDTIVEATNYQERKKEFTEKTKANMEGQNKTLLRKAVKVANSSQFRALAKQSNREQYIKDAFPNLNNTQCEDILSMVERAYNFDAGSTLPLARADRWEVNREFEEDDFEIDLEA